MNNFESIIAHKDKIIAAYNKNLAAYEKTSAAQDKTIAEWESYRPKLVDLKLYPKI